MSIKKVKLKFLQKFNFVDAIMENDTEIRHYVLCVTTKIISIATATISIVVTIFIVLFTPLVLYQLLQHAGPSCSKDG